MSLVLACRGTLQFQHTLGEKVEAWPGTMGGMSAEGMQGKVTKGP